MKNYHEMCEKLSSSLRSHLLSFSGILLLIIFTPEIVSTIDLIKSGGSNPIFDGRLSKSALMIVIPLAQASLAFFASFFVHIELHGEIDLCLFRMRKKASSVIVNNLTHKCKIVSCKNTHNIIERPQDAMRQFYSLESLQVIDRSILFDRWFRYYMNLYLIVFASALTAGCIAMYYFTFNYSQLLVAASVFAIIAISAIFDILFRLQNKLLELARFTPMKLLFDNEMAVRRGMLIVCMVPESMCPWVVDK